MRTISWYHPSILGEARDFEINFKGRTDIKFKLEGGRKYEGGNLTIFSVLRILFFIMFEYFCVESKTKMNLLRQYYRTYFLIVSLKLPKFKFFKRILTIFEAV